MRQQVYFFSGLGADERVFQQIDLDDVEIHFIQWIKPLANEKIESYAKRISVQIEVNRPILVGLSFGGIMAQEVAKIIEVKATILLASVACRAEIPFYLKSLDFIPVHRLVPKGVYAIHHKLLDWAFGINTKQEHDLLKAIINDTDTDFAAWAVHQVVSWNQSQKPSNVICVHGSSDRIFPLKFVNPDYIIKDGGHFMTLNKYKEVNKVLNRVIRELANK